MLLGLHGAHGAGKNWIADRLCERHGFAQLSFGDPLRASLEALDPLVETPTGNAYAPPGHARLSAVLAYFDGWDRAKREVPEVRRLLRAQGEGMKGPAGDDVWVQALDREVRRVERAGAHRVVFTDVRFDVECLYVLGHHSPHTGSVMFNQIWHVTRPGNPHADPTDPHAQLSIDPRYVTSRVENDETLDEQLDELVTHMEAAS